MQEILCPQCSVINSASAIECRQCHFPFGNLSPSSFVTVPNAVQSPDSGFQADVLPNNQTGRRTYFWYRMYCAALVVLYLIFVVLGIMAIIGSYRADIDDPQNSFKGGGILVILGGIFSLIYLVGVISSPKPTNWVLGIVLIALGMVSICFVPLTLPLLFFWLKPETRGYFGRQ